MATEILLQQPILPQSKLSILVYASRVLPLADLVKKCRLRRRTQISTYLAPKSFVKTFSWCNTILKIRTPLLRKNERECCSFFQVISRSALYWTKPKRSRIIQTDLRLLPQREISRVRARS